MANFNNIKNEIDQNVNTNGVQAITGAILNETLKDMIDEVDEKKQDTLVAGSGIAINGNVISATGGSGGSYTAGDGIDIDPNNVISVDASDLAGDGLKEDSNGKLAVDPNEFQEKLTAGSNIQISGSTISATDTTYSAGQGLDLNGTTFSVDYDEVQEKLESGQNIKTVNGNSLLGSGDIVIGGGGGGNYLPLEGGTLQNTAAGEDTELKVIDGMDEDYVKIVAPESAGEAPHVEIFENGSGDTKIYYDHIERGSQVSIDLPSSSGTLALTSDIPGAGSGLIENQNGEFEVDTTAIQEKLVAGQNITINGNVISASGGSGQSYVAGSGIDITGNTISVDNTVATTSDLAGYLPLTGGNLQASSIATEVRVKSPSDDSYVYLHAVDSGSPDVKLHRDIQNPTNGEVHEIDIKQDRIDIERWDQSGNTWMADTLYFPEFKTGTIALTSDLAGKQDTLTAGSGITIDANNVISATGGSGQSYTAGSGISIDSNNVISNTAPSLWRSGSGTGAIRNPVATNASGFNSVALGYSSTASGTMSTTMGSGTKATAASSLAAGLASEASGAYSTAIGNHVETKNESEFGTGKYNKSDNSNSDALKTTFSVGNGNGTAARSNSLEIKANNDLYVSGIGSYDGTNAGNVGVESVQDVINGKQDTLTAGTGISIQNNVISATGGGGGTTYTASSGIDISPNNEISVSAGNGLGFDPNTNALQIDWSSIPTGNGLVYAPDPVDPNFSYIQVDTNTIQEKLVAGSNITINGNVISASGGGSGSGLWVNGTGTNSLLSPAAQANNSDATGTASVAGGRSSVLGNYSAAFGTAEIGNQTYPNSDYSFAAGNAKVYGHHSVGIGAAEIWGDNSVALGYSSTVMSANYAVAINADGISSDYGFSAAGGYAGGGNPNTVAPFYQVSIGKDTKTYNESEVALGRKNKSSHGNTDATKTFFSIGDSRTNVESNVFEIMRNDDLYVKSVGGFDGTNAGAAGIKTLQTVLNGKQDQLTAGTGISIQGNVISATGGSGASYTAGAGITIDQNNQISANPDGSNIVLDSNNQLNLDFTGVAGNLQGTGLQVDSNTGATLEVDFSQIPGNIAGNGLQDSGNGTLEIDTTTIVSDLSSSFLPLEGGTLQQTDTAYPQTSFDVYSPDSTAQGYIYSYSEDTSDPRNPIPASVEIGLAGQTPEGIGKTAGIYLRSNGTIAVDYTVDAHGTTDMVELELPRKASGQTYTIATLDDIQGGGGSFVAGNGINISGSTISVDTGYLDNEYLPLTGGQIQANPSDAETLLDVSAPDSTSAISMSADTIDSKLAISADKSNAGISDGDTFRTVLSNTGEIQVAAKTVNPLDPTDIGETTYTLVLPQKNDTIATLSDIQGGGSSYTAGTGISIDANNVITNTAPGLWTSGTGTNSLLSPAAKTNGNANGNFAVSAGSDTKAEGSSSFAVGKSSKAAGDYSFAGGQGAEVSSQANWSFAFGQSARAKSASSLVIGPYSSVETNSAYSVAIGNNVISSAQNTYAIGLATRAKNANEIAFGPFNNSINSGTTAEKTSYTIGNGTADNSRSNLIEAKQNNDIYVLGIGGFDGTNASQALTLQTVINSKQNQLVSGVDVKTINGQSIVGGGNLVISGGSYTAGQAIDITNDAISVDYGNGLGLGTNGELQVEWSEGPTALAGSGLSANTQTGQLDVDFTSVQGKLTAGSGITISGNTISATGGGGSSLWTSGTGTDSLLGPGAISADGDYSIAAGYGSIAGPDYSVALGGGNVVFDDETDPQNPINAQYGVAIGEAALVETEYSLAMMGGTASAQNGGSHSVAIGDGATAEGMYDVALTGSSSRGNYSFAASTGIAEGHYSTGLSGGEGNGEGSLASGFGSVAFGYSSAALGLNLMTYDQADGTDPADSNAGEAALGRYNYSEQNVVFSIGCGHHEPPVDPTDPADVGTDVRENAITITNDGKIFLKGLGGYTGTSVSGCTDLVSFLNNL